VNGIVRLILPADPDIILNQSSPGIGQPRITSLFNVQNFLSFCIRALLIAIPRGFTKGNSI
jgi:hypothetical protein